MQCKTRQCNRVYWLVILMLAERPQGDTGLHLNLVTFFPHNRISFCGWCSGWCGLCFVWLFLCAMIICWLILEILSWSEQRKYLPTSVFSWRLSPDRVMKSLRVHVMADNNKCLTSHQTWPLSEYKANSLVAVRCQEKFSLSSRHNTHTHTHTNTHNTHTAHV